MTTVNLKAALEGALRDVEGWLYLDEAWALHEAVRRLDANSEPVTVVEIGSWKGRSTIALALGVIARGTGIVYAIDPHTGAPSSTAMGPAVTVQDFRNNLAASGADSVVELLVTTSHAARPQFQDCSVDILFVDGSHEFEDVKRDIIDWSTALSDSAIVAFNDPSSPGVYHALRALVLRSKGPYRRPRLVQNTLFFEFQRRRGWTTNDALALLRLQAVLQLRFQASRFRPYMPSWLVRSGHAISTRMVGSPRV